MAIDITGHLAKMETQLYQASGAVSYQMVLDDQRVPMNPLIGQTLSLKYLGDINCQHCGRRSKTSFNQGYCYPCFSKLAQCDSCIISPEKCHFHHGTCREPEWGETYCFTDHFVYLANSSGIKVGITRGTQLPTRWIDQGATQGLPIFRVKTRYQAGLIEDRLRSHVADKTHWQKMLKGNAEAVDLAAQRDELFEKSGPELALLEEQFGVQALQRLYDVPSTDIVFPVSQWPDKISSLNMDKQPLIQGVLQGIKGQYLLFDTGVINIRKYTAYRVQLSVRD